MKNKFNRLPLCLLISIFLCLNLGYLIFSPVLLREIKTTNELTDFGESSIKTSGLIPPIFIDDIDPNFNWSKTASDNVWCSGSGTENAPYLIRNVTINAYESGHCIEIKNSNDVFFKIKNCTTYNSSFGDAGIKLYNVSKGTIENNTVYDNYNGMDFRKINNVSILENTIKFNKGRGIMIDWGNYSTILENNKKK